MNLLSYALLEECDLNAFSTQAEFRKYTKNMKLVTAVTEKALERAPKNLTQFLKETRYQSLVAVLGTSLGELDVTKDFLVTYANSGLARPILFQNSLHNATLGQLTMHLGMTGPALTVSHRFFSAENALDTAKLFMCEETPFALVICADIVVKDFIPGYAKIYPKRVTLKDGAAAGLFCSDEALKKWNLTALAQIHDFDIQMKAEKTPEDGLYYDSNGLEKWLLSVKDKHV